jgi:hypothetical protein
MQAELQEGAVTSRPIAEYELGVVLTLFANGGAPMEEGAV